MARRRKSSKGDGALGAIIVVVIAAAVIYNFIVAYLAQILITLGIVVLGWFSFKMFRRHLRKKAEEALIQPKRVSNYEPRTPVPAPVRSPTQKVIAPNRTPPPLPTTGNRAAAVRTSAKSAMAKPPTNENIEMDEDENYSTPDVRIRSLFDKPKTSTRPSPPAAGAPRWIPYGESVTISGIAITDGLFYLGAPTSAYETQPCFIDPNQIVAKTRSSKDDPPTYYPSYTKFNPSQRRGFLQWMAGGRTDPDENLSLVFLFFYGLEHRVFKEGAIGDAPRLISEVERLLTIYGRNRSFTGYAAHFLTYARAALRVVSEPPELDFGSTPYEMPLDARIYLGGKLAEGRELQADDALIWAVSSPIVWRKRWSNGQKDVFEHLWRSRFTARFPNGLRVQVPKTTIDAVYSPASRSFQASVHGAFEQLPDPLADAVTPVTLKVLVDECWAEGGSYANPASKRQESQSPISAIVSIPLDVWVKRNERLLKTLAVQLGKETANFRIVPIADIFEKADLPVAVTPKTLLTILRRFAEGLWTLGIGFEPDGTYADADVSFSSPACLFWLPDAYRSRGYSVPVNVGARAVADIAILCALAAENADLATRARIAASVADGIGADDLERARLGAFACVSTPSPGRQQRLLRAASQFSEQLRITAARASIVGATSAKRMSAQVVRQLENVHKALNLPVGELYGALHRGPEDEAVSTTSDPADLAFEAVKRELDGQTAAGASSTAIAIDPERLARAREATQAVSKVLSNVFSETEAPADGVAAPANAAVHASSPSTAPFDGLDRAHGALLLAVLDAGALPRSEFERVAKSMKMFADGAIDHINEWAFDHLEGPVVEDDDPITITPPLAARLNEMRRDRP